MPRLTGAFDLLKGLEQIPPENITRWLKYKLEPQRVADFVANRTYYPQTVATTKEEMAIDLAILRESLKFNQDKFFNKISKIILIPKSFQNRYTPLTKLIEAFLDGLVLEGVTQIMVEESSAGSTASKKVEVGSVYTFMAKTDIKINLDGKDFILGPNSLTLFPIKQGEKVININQEKFTIIGGKVGFFIDLREKKWLS